MDLATHWDTVYANKDSQAVSWYQPRPEVSLRLIARVAEPGASIVDVGAGASTLVDHLVQAGYDDVLLLDIARSALEVVRRRLGCIDAVRTQVADIRTWVPSRQFDPQHRPRHLQ